MYTQKEPDADDPSRKPLKSCAAARSSPWQRRYCGSSCGGGGGGDRQRLYQTAQFPLKK